MMIIMMMMKRKRRKKVEVAMKTWLSLEVGYLAESTVQYSEQRHSAAD